MEEEIKLVIIFILALCSFVKVRNWRTPTHKQMPPQQKQTAVAMQEDEEKQQVDPQAIAKYQNQLFPPTPMLPRTLPPRPQPDSYCKSIVGVTYEEDPSSVYSSRYIHSNPFYTGARRIVRTNEDYLKQIQQLLLGPPAYEHPPIYERPHILSMPSPMRPEEEESSEQPKTSLLKRKNISKKHRWGKKRPIECKPLQKPLFSRLPLQIVKKRKKEAVFDIDKQIERRKEEIKVLERLKKRRGKLQNI